MRKVLILQVIQSCGNENSVDASPITFDLENDVRQANNLGPNNRVRLDGSLLRMEFVDERTTSALRAAESIGG